MTERPAQMYCAPVIAVSDLDHAREFYEGKLGLDGAATPGGWTVSALALPAGGLQRLEVRHERLLGR